MLTDIIEMKFASIADRHQGPWIVYVSSDYEQYLDEDYKSSSERTLRQRILAVDGIAGVSTSDRLPTKTVLLVELQKVTVEEVVGFYPTVVQWQEHGGLKLNFKVMAILVPRIRSDYSNRCGIVHAST